MGECKYCGTVHPEGEIANPHYCIARLCEQLEEKDKEIAKREADAERWAKIAGQNQKQINKLADEIERLKRRERWMKAAYEAVKEDGDG